MEDSMLKPVNTVFSVDSIIDIPELTKAKLFMNENYGNQYSHVPPHLAYTIMPFPEVNFESGRRELLEYIKTQRSYTVHISDLIYDEKGKFYYVALEGDIIKKLHEDITLLLNRYRDNCVREKDLERLKNGDFDERSKQYLNDYGYTKVFDNFRTHITVGNYTIESVDVEDLTKKLRDMLKPILDKDWVIDNIHAIFHTDSAVNQSEMKVMWEEVLKI